jgi:hypothetical protein
MKPTIALLAFALITQAQAQQLPEAPTPQLTPKPDPAWDRVEQLQPGQPISLLQQTRPYPTSCTLEAATEDSVTCTAYNPYRPPQRLVFPRRNVAALWTEEQVPAPHWGALVGLTAPTGIFAIVGGARDGSQGAGLGALIGLLISGAAAGATLPQQPPHYTTRRHLIYTAPPA